MKIRYIFANDLKDHMKQVGWPNGKALDYESRDCRFDPCVDQLINLAICEIFLLLFAYYT